LYGPDPTLGFYLTGRSREELAMKYMTRIATVFLAMLALAAPALADEAPNTAEVLGKLHSSNVKAYRLGKMALTRGRTEDVQIFAKAMIDDRDAVDSKLADLAKQKDITLAAHTPEVVTLKLPTGAAFDAAFARNVLRQSGDDIAMVKEARDRTDDQQLRALLIGILPTLEKQQQVAQTLVTKGTGT
jgi:putative membrane protein